MGENMLLFNKTPAVHEYGHIGYSVALVTLVYCHSTKSQPEIRLHIKAEQVQKILHKKLTKQEGFFQNDKHNSLFIALLPHCHVEPKLHM